MPRKGERRAVSKVAFKAYPKETKVRKELAGICGQKKVVLTEVYDFSDPYL